MTAQALSENLPTPPSASEVFANAAIGGEILSELIAASALHKATFASQHEAYAVILEELEEFKYWVFVKPGQRDRRQMRHELIQTAAKCIRAIKSLDEEEAPK